MCVVVFEIPEDVQEVQAKLWWILVARWQPHFGEWKVDGDQAVCDVIHAERVSWSS